MKILKKCVEKCWWINTILLVLIAVVYTFTPIYSLFTERTDENSFINLSNFLYIDSEFPAIKLSNHTLDTLNNSYVIVGIEGQAIDSLETLDIVKKRDHFLEVTALYLPEAKTYKYKVDTTFLQKENFKYHKSRAYIVSVEKGGKSEKAGILPGDIILSVNGKDVQNAFVADRYVKLLDKGETIEYQMLRNGGKIICNVEITGIQIQIYKILILLTGFLMILMGSFIGLKRPRLKVARLTSMALVMLGALVANAFNITLVNTSSVTYIVILGFFILQFLTFPLILHSLCYFPKENNFLTKHRWIVTSFYVIALIGIIFLFIGLNTLVLFNGIAVILMGIVIPLMLFTTAPADFQIVKPIYISYLIFMLGFLLRILVPILSYKNAIVTTSISQMLESIILLSVFVPIAYYYVIGSNHLLDINIRFKRNILYVVATFIFKVILIGLFLALAYFLFKVEWRFPYIAVSDSTITFSGQALAPEMQKIYERVAIFFSLFIYYLLSRKVYKSGTVIIDSMFFKANIDSRTLTENLRTISNNTDNNPDEIAKIFVNTIGQSFMMKRAGLWLFQNDALFSKQYYGLEQTQDFDEFADLYATQLQQEMTTAKGAFLHIDYISNDMKEVFRTCEFEYIIKLNAKEKCLGLLFIGEKLLESKYTNEDLTFFADISAHTSVVLENAILTQSIVQQERLRHEIELARSIQSASMPETSVVVAGLDTAAISKPAYEVGGDFYDFYRHQDNELDIIVGDVSGKGTSAALYMSNALGVVRTLSRFKLEPQEVLCNMNDIMKRQIKKGNFITAVTASFDTIAKTATIARAGHTPSYHYQASSQKVVAYQPKGLALGLVGSKMFDKNLERQTVSIANGDVFMFISDGITESRDRDYKELGDGLVFSTLQTHHNLNAKAMLNTLMQTLDNTCNGQYLDDVTVVIVKINDI